MDFGTDCGQRTTVRTVVNGLHYGQFTTNYGQTDGPCTTDHEQWLSEWGRICLLFALKTNNTKGSQIVVTQIFSSQILLVNSYYYLVTDKSLISYKYVYDFGDLFLGKVIL